MDEKESCSIELARTRVGINIAEKCVVQSLRDGNYAEALLCAKFSYDLKQDQKRAQEKCGVN